MMPIHLYGAENRELTDQLVAKLESIQTELAKFTTNEAPLLALCWPTMKTRVLCWKLISFLRKIGSEESFLPASILVDEVYSMHPLFSSASSWKLTLALTLLYPSLQPIP